VRDGTPPCRHRQGHHWNGWPEVQQLEAACSWIRYAVFHHVASQTGRRADKIPYDCRSTPHARHDSRPGRSVRNIHTDMDDVRTHVSEITNKFLMYADSNKLPTAMTTGSRSAIWITLADNDDYMTMITLYINKNLQVITLQVTPWSNLWGIEVLQKQILQTAGAGQMPFMSLNITRVLNGVLKY